MFPQQSLLAVFHGALSAAAHHSGSSILLCAAVLSCCAQELAATPGNEVCSPESPVLFILMPLVPGTTSMSWNWASLKLLACHQWVAASGVPTETPWRQLGCHIQSPTSTKHNSLAHPSIRFSKLLQCSLLQVMAALSQQLVQRPLLSSFIFN